MRLDEAKKILEENGIKVVKLNERLKNIQIARADHEKYIAIYQELKIDKEITVCWVC